VAHWKPPPHDDHDSAGTAGLGVEWTGEAGLEVLLVAVAPGPALVGVALGALPLLQAATSAAVAARTAGSRRTAPVWQGRGARHARVVHSQAAHASSLGFRQPAI
jgi:hypothetical protein